MASASLLGNTVVELVPGKGENPKRGAAVEEV